MSAEKKTYEYGFKLDVFATKSAEQMLKMTTTVEGTLALMKSQSSERLSVNLSLNNKN